MIEITEDFKAKVLAALAEARKNYDGLDVNFAKKYGINKTVYSELKKGKTTKKITAAKWLELGRVLNVRPDERRWKMARTEVFDTIEDRVLFCKEFAKARMFVDECAIGKTYSARYLSRTLKNCFYVDASQCRSRCSLIRMLARSVGAETAGTSEDMEEEIKYILCVLPKPVIIIDEAGCLSYSALESLHGLWNGTEDCCGWFMMGADGLRTKLQRGKRRSKKSSFKELFSRFSSKYDSIVPRGHEDRMEFYRKLIGDVLTANVNDPELVTKVTNQCLATDSEEEETGLRRAESLLILGQEEE